MMKLRNQRRLVLGEAVRETSRAALSAPER